jgi:hypothetical protein
MAFIMGYGGTVTLNIDGGGVVTYPARNISVNHERQALDITQLSDYQEKRAPGRYRRTASFDMIAQDGSTDSALRSHIVPSSLANALNRTATLAFANASITYTIVGFITSATRTDDGTGPGIWSITLEEA